jgi:putative flavoprotein involved in K+ transport
VQLNRRVLAVRAGEDGYLVESEEGTFEAAQVVIATGPFQQPRVPRVAEQLDGDVVQLHSSQYRRPDDVPDGPVLIVGGGNTGYQIAEELAATREVHLSVGSRQTPLPQRLLGRDLFRYLEGAGLMRLTVNSRVGQRMQHRDVLIGSSRAPQAGGTASACTAARSTSPPELCGFADGTALTPNAVIWATGFALDHSFVDLPVFGEDGGLVTRRGVTRAPGLYFLGLPWQHTRGSALLGWVEDDAEHIATQIARYKPSASRSGSSPGL